MEGLEINLEVGASVKTCLEKECGAGCGCWIRPLPTPRQGRSAGGAAYMVMWTAVLAGDDGMGRDFDMFHFTDPPDMGAFYGCGRDDVTGCLDRLLTARAAADDRLRRAVADDSTRRQAQSPPRAR